MSSRLPVYVMETLIDGPLAGLCTRCDLHLRDAEHREEEPYAKESLRSITRTFIRSPI